MSFGCADDEQPSDSPDRALTHCCLQGCCCASLLICHFLQVGVWTGDVALIFAAARLSDSAWYDAVFVLWQNNPTSGSLELHITSLHAASSMIHSQAFKLHKNNSWRTPPRKKALTFCCWRCLLYTVEPAVSRYYLYTARCHGNDSRPRCLYMWTGGEREKNKDGRENRESYSLIVVVPCCYVRQAKYRWELWVLCVCARTILFPCGDHFIY